MRLLQDLNSRPESQQPEIQMRTKKTGKKTRDRAGSGGNLLQTESDRAGSTDPRGDFQGGMPGKSELPPHSSLVHDRALQDDVHERPWEQPLQVQNALTSHSQSRYDLDPSECQVVSQAGSFNVSRQASPVQPTFEDTYGVDEIDEMSPPPGEHINNAVARRQSKQVGQQLENCKTYSWNLITSQILPNQRLHSLYRQVPSSGHSVVDIASTQVARYVGQVISARQDNAKKVADALARQVKKTQVSQIILELKNEDFYVPPWRPYELSDVLS
jgi:hypothetical protein